MRYNFKDPRYWGHTLKTHGRRNKKNLIKRFRADYSLRTVSVFTVDDDTAVNLLAGYMEANLPNIENYMKHRYERRAVQLKPMKVSNSPIGISYSRMPDGTIVGPADCYSANAVIAKRNSGEDTELYVKTAFCSP